MESAFGKVKTLLAGLGVTLSVGAFAKFTLDIIKANAALVDLSSQTGASVENLSKLQTIAKLGGQNFEDLAGQLGVMVKGLKSGNEEGQKASAALRFLGVSAKNADGSFRDTAVIVTDVAHALAKYADDGNKVALVQDALGKGAERFIPYLKDIVELGGANARITEEQAKQAKAFEESVSRLKLALEDAQQVLVNEYGASLTKMVQQMAEGVKIFGSFGSALYNIGFGIDPFKSLAQNAKELRDELDKIRSEDAYGRALRGTFLGGPDEDTVRKRLEFIKFMQRQEALAGRTGPQFFDARDLQAHPALLPSSKYQSPDLSANAREAKLYTSALQQLEEELGKLNDMTKAELVINRVTVGSWKDLTTEHKAYLISIAGEYDLRANRIKQIDAEYAAIIKLVEVRQALDALQSSNFVANKRERDEAQFQVDLIGKSAREQEKLIAARRIDLDMRRRIDEQLALLPEDALGSDTKAIIEAEEARAQAQKRTIVNLIDARQTAERDWLTGAKSAFNEYVDDATNAARNTHDLFINAFHSMEDAVFKFVKTGKLDFRDFADSVIDDIIRIQIRMGIARTVAGAQGFDFLGLFGGGNPGGPTDATGLTGGTFASGGRPPVGKVSLVGEEGPELFVPDSAGTIIPKGRFGGVSVVHRGDIIVGDGVSMTQVRQALAISQRQTVALIRDLDRR